MEAVNEAIRLISQVIELLKAKEIVSCLHEHSVINDFDKELDLLKLAVDKLASNVP